jgi:putative nucleotidyltransferase with HDIG domain
LAQDLADRAALAIANARLLGDVRSELALRRRGEAELRKLDMIHSTLSHVNHAIVHLRRPDELFAEVCRTIVEEGGYRAAWVGLVDPDGARVRPVAEAGAAAGYVSNVDIVLGDPKRGNGPTGICISERRHVICQDIENDPRMAPWRENALRHGYRSSASFPLTMGDATVGALTMYSDEAGFFDDQQVDLLDELAMDVSFAMEFTREETRRAQADEEILKQSERISKTLTSVIDIAGTIVEARDPYTAGHQRRVAQIATAIARELGMSDREIADIEVAGLIHDIGKVQIPAEILGKPGAITALEYAILQTHAEAGYRIVVSANMEVSISEMVYQHHERCDGSGYPRGLTAEQLLPGAKVLAVADVVEAMMSHRPYRPALGIDAALAEIERGAGTAYDAAASRACIALFRENGFELD